MSGFLFCNVSVLIKYQKNGGRGERNLGTTGEVMHLMIGSI